jgi:hypothetical protein
MAISAVGRYTATVGSKGVIEKPYTHSWAKRRHRKMRNELNKRSQSSRQGWTVLKVVMVVVFICTTYSVSQVFAVGTVPAKVEEVIRKAFPANKFTQDEVVFGDLNQDDLDDFAVLLLAPNPKQKPGGDYQLFAISGDVYPHMRVFVSLEIKRKSLFLYRHGGDAISYWKESFQFKMRGNDLVLIGMESSTIAEGDEPNGHGTSANYLTNEVIFWREVGKKRKEIRKKISAFDLIKLRSFNYNNYEDIFPKGTRGYIDEDFSFRNY